MLIDNQILVLGQHRLKGMYVAFAIGTEAVTVGCTCRTLLLLATALVTSFLTVGDF